MSKVSKTARASAGMVVREVKVIPDEVYIKNLRNDLDSGLYVAQEGARALLRAYDTALNTINELNERVNSLQADSANQANLTADLYKNNQALDAELKAALSQVETLTQEFDATHVKDVSNSNPSTKYDGAGDFGTHRAYDDHN